mmetsp:Transcript_9575/g.31263  ORF Transcript_9575/g.31263 Transcript_9575/m.31263 type:complete len:341 (+) Transcript_9575:1-1023(+)
MPPVYEPPPPTPPPAALTPAIDEARRLQTVDSASLTLADFFVRHLQKGAPLLLRGHLAAEEWGALAYFSDLRALHADAGERLVPVSLGSPLVGHGGAAFSPLLASSRPPACPSTPSLLSALFPSRWRRPLAVEADQRWRCFGRGRSRPLAAAQAHRGALAPLQRDARAAPARGVRARPRAALQGGVHVAAPPPSPAPGAAAAARRPSPHAGPAPLPDQRLDRHARHRHVAALGPVRQPALPGGWLQVHPAVRPQRDAQAARHHAALKKHEQLWHVARPRRGGPTAGRARFGRRRRLRRDHPRARRHAVHPQERLALCAQPHHERERELLVLMCRWGVKVR